MCTPYYKIRTDVFVSKTGLDDLGFGRNVELQTTISESGNCRNQSDTSDYKLPQNATFDPPVKVASATFSGYKLPKTMKIRMIELDSLTPDDGICFFKVTPPSFSCTPTVVKCIRESKNGLWKDFVVTAKVYRID